MEKEFLIKCIKILKIKKNGVFYQIKITIYIKIEIIIILKLENF
jgi:hypothetical protein